MSRKKDLKNWLAHIESFHPHEIELGLARIKQVADKLNLQSLPGRCILVAGTNGKGSCVAILEAIALLSEQSVASYTSPHLVAFNERIRINGKNVDDHSLVDAFEQIEAARMDIPLTFFEFTTLAALLIFSQYRLDLVVLEVGLGGRQDATNIIAPDACIISTVDKDHIDWLGDSLEQIAYEKAGIIRANKPAIIGDQKTFELITKVVPEYATECQLIDVASEWLKEAIASPEANRSRLLEQNIMAAKKAYERVFADSLDQQLITDQRLAQALRSVHINGRFQVLASNNETVAPTIVVDVAHNPQAAQNLASQLKQFQQAQQIQSTTAICGMMKDKAIDEVLSVLAPIIDRWCFVDLALPRAIRAKALNERYKALGLASTSQCFESVADAISNLKATQTGVAATNKSLILVFGSFITVANMLQYHSDNE